MYYKLILESGHIGAGKSLESVRYFRAEDPVSMFSMASRIPRVKGKNLGTGVKLIKSVSREEYIEGIRKSEADGYLNTRKRKRRSKRKKEVLYH